MSADNLFCIALILEPAWFGLKNAPIKLSNYYVINYLFDPYNKIVKKRKRRRT